MLLSSLRRLRLYCAGEGVAPITDNLLNNRLLMSWLSPISRQIERALKRQVEIQAMTEFFDVSHSKVEFWVNAAPMYSLVDVYEEPRALWTGYEREIQYAILEQYRNSIVMPFAMTYIQQRALRVRYYGGMAYHAVNSRYYISTKTGTFVVGKYVKGSSSGAMGLVNTINTNDITIETYYGEFTVGETIVQYDDESTPTASTVSAVISLYPEIGFTSYNGLWVVNKWIKGRVSGAIGKIASLNYAPVSSLTLTPVSGTFLNNEAVDQYEDAACLSLSSTPTYALIYYVNNRSLAETYPEIVSAVEMQLRYMRRHQLDFENSSSSKDSSTQREHSGSDYNRFVLLPEVLLMIEPYIFRHGF